jgi:hypothetical protein
METFQECGVQMLREFRALLQQTPLPVNQTRLLQLLALNMFAVSNTQLKGKNKTKTEIDPRRKTSSSQPHPRNLSKLPSECSRVLDRLFGALGKPLALERKKQEERGKKNQINMVTPKNTDSVDGRWIGGTLLVRNVRHQEMGQWRAGSTRHIRSQGFIT